MELLDVLTIYHGSEARTIELHCGDLTNMTPQESVDMLVISTFANDYLPISGTSIGNLYRKGVTVEELAKAKAIDMRPTCSCWLSQELVTPPAGIHFKRILCFEPPMFGSVPNVVGDIFRALVPILSIGQPASIVLPLIAIKSQNETTGEVLTTILDAAARWMALGLPLKQLKIVEQSSAKVAELRRVFERLKAAYPANLPVRGHEDQYDTYISYAPGDSAPAQAIIDQLRAQRPDLRLASERLPLNPFAAWQQPIYQAIDQSRAMIALYSPAYLRSKVCQEEFNIAFYRHHMSGGLLFPILVHSAQLPAYMQQLASFDWRSGHAEELQAACARFLADLASRG
jgi:hypothetical protein